MTITGQSATIRSKDNVYYPPVNLDAGIPTRLSLSDLSPYFNPNNLDFQGITKAQYQQSGKLPEGFYQFCFEAVELNTGRVVSQNSCSMAWAEPERSAPAEPAGQGRERLLPGPAEHPLLLDTAQPQ